MGRAAAMRLCREEEERKEEERKEERREDEERNRGNEENLVQMGFNMGLEGPYRDAEVAEVQNMQQYADMQQEQRGRGEGGGGDEEDEGDEYSLPGFDRDRSTSSLAAEAIEGAIALGLSLGVGHRPSLPSLPSLPPQLQAGQEAGRGGGRGGGRVSGSAGTLGGLAALLESPQASMRRVATADAATKRRSLGRYQKAALSRSSARGGLRGLRKEDGEASWLTETLLTGTLVIE